MYLEPADAEITPLVSPKNTTRPTDYATRLSKKYHSSDRLPLQLQIQLHIHSRNFNSMNSLFCIFPFFFSASRFTFQVLRSGDESGSNSTMVGAIAVPPGVSGTDQHASVARLPAATASDREEVAESKCRASLALLLLEEGDTPVATSTVSSVALDSAFVEYSRLLGASPTSLERDWQTGQTVLQQLNELHGEDSLQVFQPSTRTTGTSCTRTS